MAISRSTNPVLHFTGKGGMPLSGGKVYVYKNRTHEDAVTYNSLGQRNENPVRIDISGNADIWLDDACKYTFVVKNAVGGTEYTLDDVPTNTRTFKAECNDGTMDVVEREEDGVTTYTFGLKDNSIGWAKLKEPRHLIADTDWVEFEAQPNSDYVVVSLAPALRTWLEEQGYNG